MLSQHPEGCRFPHGHTRRIEVVVAGESVDGNGMLVDFKALKLALTDYIDRYDHSMAINSEDPLLPTLQEKYPGEAVVVFDGIDPTTEVIARDIFKFAAAILSEGFVHGHYKIAPGQVKLERIRGWETPQSWAEYSE